MLQKLLVRARKRRTHGTPQHVQPPQDIHPVLALSHSKHSAPAGSGTASRAVGGAISALDLLASKRPLVIGHRGYCQFAPENTLPSFNLALSTRCDMVELDYRHSKDNVPVVIHDPYLDRTTDAVARWRRRRIKVLSKTADEIRALDAGKWFSPGFAGTCVPLLSEALDAIQDGSMALIERKAGAPSECIALLRARQLVNRVVVQAFDWNFLCRFRQEEPEAVLAALGPARILPNGKRPFGISRRLNAAWLNQAEKTGARIIVWSQKLSKRSVALAHQRGFKVWVYTVDNTRLARRLLNAGVDGIISNNPAVIWKSLAVHYLG